ncbi:MAG: GNAT family N-acetyltransferase [Thermoguttaceae bacterium]
MAAQSIHFRHFRNSDPPALVAVWRSRTGQPELDPTVDIEVFEQFVLAKTYFDPEGLILACDGDRVLGFVHASFGANDAEDGISTELGTTALLLVRPDCDEAQVAAGLLEHSEAYLRQRGAKVIYGGGIRPLNSFYLGLYGGSELPGVPESDTVAQQVFTSHGYREIDRTLLFHRNLSTFEAVVDRRQMQVRRQMVVEVVIDPPTRTWWEACTLGKFDVVRFALIPRTGGSAVASAIFRRMELVPTTMQPFSVGLIEVWVEESARRRGLAIFLLSEAFRQFIRENTSEVEVQAMQHNLAAQALYRKMGFQQFGRGSVFRKE